MTCYRPQPAWQSMDKFGEWTQTKIIYPLHRNVDGSREYGSYLTHVENRANGRDFRLFTVPCGLCFGCRSDNTRSWSLRMMHEARYHEHCYFITLTYSPENLPPDADLEYSHLTDFWKRARHIFQKPGRPFKYFACGEYGDENLRPHYHFAGFSFDIPDLKYFKSVKGNDYFLSDKLRDCWGHGHVVIGALDWMTAAYIARYVTKKMHGKNVRQKRIEFDPDTGEITRDDMYTIERAFQSKGLGLSFYNDHFDEIWNLDGCLYNRNYLVKPPRYYFEKLKKSDPDRAEAIKLARSEKAPNFDLDISRDRELLYQMEARRLQMQNLKRSL